MRDEIASSPPVRRAEAGLADGEQDWGTGPDVLEFVGRLEELAALREWVARRGLWLCWAWAASTRRHTQHGWPRVWRQTSSACAGVAFVTTRPPASGWGLVAASRPLGLAIGGPHTRFRSISRVGAPAIARLAGLAQPTGNHHRKSHLLWRRLFLSTGGAWRWVLGLAAVPAGFLLVGVALPDTPRFLLHDGQTDAASGVGPALRRRAGGARAGGNREGRSQADRWMARAPGSRHTNRGGGWGRAGNFPASHWHRTVIYDIYYTPKIMSFTASIRPVKGGFTEKH